MTRAPGFLIVTTKDLPEAYFLARHLDRRGQRIAFLNITGRPWPRALRVLGRLGRRHGWLYLADLLLAKAVRALSPPSGVDPFPEVAATEVARIRDAYPRLDTRDPHAPHVLRFVQRFDPDYILLAGAPVLRPALFTLARHGALNRHLGVLPNARGSDCPIWALALNQPESLGFSIHFVTEKVDGGSVVVSSNVPIMAGRSFDAFLATVQRRASEAFVDALEHILDGKRLPSQPQVAGGRYFAPAGFSTERRARLNYARLCDAAESGRITAAA
jgi:folate-dependent phosphoribosylglycinamide formyltransferase PurN